MRLTSLYTDRPADPIRSGGGGPMTAPAPSQKRQCQQSHRRRPSHKQYPLPRDTHYNPCAEYVISADYIDRCPSKIGEQETPLLFWLSMVRIAQLSRDVPCHGGVRYMAKKVGCCVDTFIKYRRLGKELGGIDTADQPGLGAGREPTLTWAIKSEDGKPKIWSYFPRRAESTSSAQYKTVNTTVRSYVSSCGVVSQSTTLATVTEPTAEPTDQQQAPEPTQKTSPEPVEPTVVEPTVAHELQAGIHQRWGVTVLVTTCAWILARLETAKMDSVEYIRTVQRLHSPQKANRPEAFWRWVTLQIIGQYIGKHHGGDQPVSTRNILPEEPKITVARCDRETPPPLTSRQIPPDKSTAINNTPVAQPRPPSSRAEPRTIDRDTAVRMLTEEGIDPEDWFAWSWHLRPEPNPAGKRNFGRMFPLQPGDMRVGITAYREAHAREPAS